MSSVKFKSFSSGSCGNCYFLGLFEPERRRCEAGVLIDAGVSPRRLKKELQADGLCFDDFSAVLITHDHLDHIRSLGSFCKHIGKPVWATEELQRALSRHSMTRYQITDYRMEMRQGVWNDVVPGQPSVGRAKPTLWLLKAITILRCCASAHTLRNCRHAYAAAEVTYRIRNARWPYKASTTKGWNTSSYAT